MTKLIKKSAAAPCVESEPSLNSEERLLKQHQVIEESNSVEAETLFAALLFLLTRYANKPEQALIQPIINHFHWIANHPDFETSHLKKTCERLQNTWLMISAETKQVPCSDCLH